MWYLENAVLVLPIDKPIKQAGFLTQSCSNLEVNDKPAEIKDAILNH